MRHVEVTCWGLNVDALGFRVGYPFVEREKFNIFFCFLLCDEFFFFKYLY